MTQRSESRAGLAVVCLIVATVLAACSGTGLPLRKDPEQIREALLAQTPIGTSADNVVQSLQAHHYRMSRAKTGFVHRTGENAFEEVGVTSVRADIGQYYCSPFSTTDVTAYWGFGVDGNLVNIWVTKDGDNTP